MMNLRILLPAIALTGLLAPATAQVPNGGFENWTTPPGAGYQDPVGWVTFNAVTTLEGGQPSCEEGTPGAVGSSYATVTTRGSAFGPIQGIISVGDPTTGSTGFAYGSRPSNFSGQWQYGIQAGDSGLVAVILTKWVASDDSSHVVGGAVVAVTGSLSGWNPLNVPFVYETSENPDSAFVIVASSLGTPVVGSFIKVDDLGFDATSGITEQATAATVNVYPSPATDVLNIFSDRQVAEVDVVDMTGRTVLRQGAFTGRATEDVSALHAGQYIVQLRMVDGTRNMRSFIKQ